ncbi:MAG: M56 family metallopeptidase [Lachnospiraceae bacterium]
MKLFFELLQISLSGAFSVIYLLLLRFLLGRFSKRVTYVLWALAAFHFISPVKPEWRLALLPKVNIADELAYAYIDWNIIAALYITGVTVLLIINGVQYFRLSLRLKRGARRADILSGERIFRYEGSSAFTFGFFHPGIYLPQGLDKESENLIILHEKMHIRRGDYWFKLIASVLCVINWYNPFAWVAFYFFSRDQEASCDELVLKKVGSEYKKQYANVIFQAASGFFVSGDRDHALAFGEANIKYRVRRCIKSEEKSKCMGGLGVVLTLAALLFGIFVSDICVIDGNAKSVSSGEVLEAIKLSNSSETYEKREDGIYLVADGKEELIVKQTYSDSDNFYYSSGGVFFTADRDRCIQRFDTDAHVAEVVLECESGRTVKRFTISRGVLEVTYDDDSTESRKLSVKQKVPATDREILENRGTIYNVTQWMTDKACAVLDLNSDGHKEEIVLDFSLKDIDEKGETNYDLWVEGSRLCKQVNSVGNNIFAVSVDGKHIFIMVEYTVKDAASGKTQWYTAFYSYEDRLVLHCELETMVSLITIEDDTISYTEHVSIIGSENVKRVYKIGSDGTFNEQLKDYMDIDKARYQLKTALSVYETPGEGNKFVIDKQDVDVYTVSGKCIRSVNSREYEGYWVELTCQDGVRGWVFVSDGILPENGLEVQEVFAAGVYHHKLGN